MPEKMPEVENRKERLNLRNVEFIGITEGINTDIID